MRAAAGLYEFGSVHLPSNSTHRVAAWLDATSDRSGMGGHHDPTCWERRNVPGGGASYSGALHPDRPVEATVLDRLKEVIFPDGISLREVSDGPRHLEDSIVGAGTKVEIVHGMFQEAVTGC